VYGRPAAQLGQGELARVEMYVDNEKDGKVQRIYLEGNLDPQRTLTQPACGLRPPPPPRQDK
jgi:hypothetical protein